VTTWYQDFDFHAILIQYFAKYHDIDIFKIISMQIIYKHWNKTWTLSKAVCQCFSTFLLLRNPTQAWRSLTEPHAVIRESSDVCEDEAMGCLRTHFLSRALRAEPSWRRQSRQRLPIQNLTALVDSSMLLYLTKHDGRGGRRRPLSHQPRKFITWTPLEKTGLRVFSLAEF